MSETPKLFPIKLDNLNEEPRTTRRVSISLKTTSIKWTCDPTREFEAWQPPI